jgi:hypothetical protein
VKLLFILLLLQKQPVTVTASLLDTIRELYHRASTDKKASSKLSETLLVVDTSSSAVLICYKGVAEMVKAKYAVSPYVKLKDFNVGKALIEKAEHKDTSVAEIRFIRFSVQTNAPAFLGYNRSIVTDKNFLLNHLVEIKDSRLKADIYTILSGSAFLSDDERKKLRILNN